MWEGYETTNKTYGYTNYDTCLTDSSLKHANNIKYSKVFNLFTFLLN